MVGKEKGRKQARVANRVLGQLNRTLISTDIYNIWWYLITVSLTFTDINNGGFSTLGDVHTRCYPDVVFNQPCIPPIYFFFFSFFWSYLLCASNETHVTHYGFVRCSVWAWVGLGSENFESKTTKGASRLDCNCLLDVLCKERIMNHHFEKRCGRALTFRPANIRNTQSQVNKQENLYHLGRQSVWDKYQQNI